MKEKEKIFGLEITVNNANRGLYPGTFTVEEEAIEAAESLEKSKAHQIEWRKNGSLSVKAVPLEENHSYLRYDGRHAVVQNGELKLSTVEPQK